MRKEKEGDEGREEKREEMKKRTLCQRNYPAMKLEYFTQL